MHPSFQQRIDELGALLQLTKAARAKCRRNFSRTPPPKPIRYQIVTTTANSFQVVEVGTGAANTFFRTYESALAWVMRLEATNNRTPVGAAR
jgi:hypothetical protein